MLPTLVLTAGLGTRLDPLTRLLAKPAVPMAGRTLIERVLDWLRHEGITNVVLNLHHRPETITSVVGDGTHLGLRVRYSWEDPLLGSAGGPRRALPLLDADPFLIVNGDTLCEVDLAPMVTAHVQRGAAVTLAVIPNPARERYNGIVLDDDDRVTGFVPKGHTDSTWHFVGVQVVNAGVFAALPDGVPAETIAGLYGELLTTQFGAIQGWRVDQPFVDVGTPRDYWRAVLDMTQTIPGVADAGARVTRSVVWPGARMAADVELDQCVVAGAVTLPRGFRARESVLVPAALVRPGEAAQVIGDVAVFPL